MARPVLEKLGWREGMTALVVGRPEAFAALPSLPRAPAEGPAPFILAFAIDAAAVPPALGAVLPRYAPGGLLWFAYPKTSGAIRTDIARDRGWEALEAAGLLPVSQVALDGTWSALRFRIRSEIPKLTRRGEAQQI